MVSRFVAGDLDQVAFRGPLQLDSRILCFQMGRSGLSRFGLVRPPPLTGDEGTRSLTPGNREGGEGKGREMGWDEEKQRPPAREKKSN